MESIEEMKKKFKTADHREKQIIGKAIACAECLKGAINSISDTMKLDIETAHKYEIVEKIITNCRVKVEMIKVIPLAKGGLCTGPPMDWSKFDHGFPVTKKQMESVKNHTAKGGIAIGPCITGTRHEEREIQIPLNAFDDMWSEPKWKGIDPPSRLVVANEMVETTNGEIDNE